ncbi:MAG TPA: sigma-70 family RNA polymerase sigma factor [Vicinamibacteria bacterium]|nr:sigma-70 family RNA polymerase sigma factor [Vicinamibacteria bacterium]
MGAAGASDADSARAALGDIIEASWRPVHALVRRGGFRGADAEDATQDYFAYFLEKRFVLDAASWGGCFRPFLRTTVRHFLSNRRDHDRAAKRGGRRGSISLEALVEAERTVPGLRHAETPHAVLEGLRFRAALCRAIERLSDESRAGGGGDRFPRLLACVLGERTPDAYATLAAEWGVGASAVRVAACRLRRRLAEILREAPPPRDGHGDPPRSQCA